jgi:hypothetical protein
MMKSSFSAVLAVALGFVAAPSSANEQCKLLDSLRVKYAGVSTYARPEGARGKADRVVHV